MYALPRPVLALLAFSLAGLGCSKKAEQTAATEAAPEAAPPAAFEAALPVRAAPADPEAVVAVVNGSEIKQADVDREVNMLMTRAQGRVPPEQMAQLRLRFQDQVVDNLVTMRLLTTEAEKQGITVTDEELDAELGKLELQANGEERVAEMLKELNATKDDLRRDIAKQVTINKLIEKRTAAVTEPTDEQITAYYESNPEQFAQPESVSAHHILVAVTQEDTPESRAEKKAQAESIRERLTGGEDFEECAQANSDCPSKARGGDLGTFARGQMVPAFEEAAFTQPVGDIGPVVETDFGYHVIRVDERKEARNIPLDEVKEQLSAYLLAQGRQQAARNYVTELREAAAIEYPGAQAAP